MPPRFKELYKPLPTGRDVRQRRLSQEAQLRRFQREQLFMGKRLRFRASQESETESEYEFTPSDTDAIRRGLKSTRRKDRAASLETLSAKLEQPSEELRRFVLEGECVDILVELLGTTDAEEKLQSLWCLTNIAAGEAAVAERVLAAVPHLLALMTSDDAELQNQAIWAVGNLAAEGEAVREKLFAGGALRPLVDVLSETHDAAVLQTACFALSNMARRPNSYFGRVFELGLPGTVAERLVEFKDDAGCVAELAWVCAYLTAASSVEQLDQIMCTGAVDSLLQQALGADESVHAMLIPIMRTLGNVAAGTDAQTHALVGKDGFLGLLIRCIESTSSRALEKESLWVLSSVTAGRKEDVDAVVDAGAVASLTRIVLKRSFDIKKEAAFSLLNTAIVGQRIADLPNEQLVPEFVEFVRCQDQELVRLGIQYIALLFEHLPDRGGARLLRGVTGGIDALEAHVAVAECDDARAMASALIDEYYVDDA
ncbi:hypothetical protein H4R18_001983 [Coemansia javaensis]|uniref:Importin subunit alpha n=1 Tax=Coemansia javaensis TaxID=2761396 RepID=A0A9W8HJV1_9FUNG|nr:hypothetical protein H4R18_001983 [Coemansia javaensis]